MRQLSYQEYYNMGSDKFLPGDVIQANVVLVIGYGGDYAIYVAPDETWDTEEVASVGDKMPLTRGEKIGENLFPTAVHGHYYRR